MDRIQISISCKTCSEVLSKTVGFLGGMASVDLDLFSQLSFDCTYCGSSNYTGDMYDSIEVEEGDGPWQDEDYDEGEWEDDE